MKTKLTFLGTGTSQGVPIIGCGCKVCTSEDPRDKRFRASVLVEYGPLTILVDAGPDFRSQMLAAKVRHLDAILLTHNHKDHTGGLDDVRSLNYVDRNVVEIYCEEKVLNSIRTEYSYAFVDKKYPGSPEWRIHLIDDRPIIVHQNKKGDLEWVHDVGYCHRMPDGSLIPTDGHIISEAEKCSFEVWEEQVQQESAESPIILPIRGFHDKMPVLGFRFGNIAYLTDMSSIPESEFAKLKGLKHLTLNTVGYKKHHSHFSLNEAVELAGRIGAKHTWLTHLSHSFPRYEEFCRELPDGIAPAYDGLVLE